MTENIIFKLKDIRSSRVLEAARLVSVVGSTQLALQIVNIITGLVIIRLLPTQEYAYYTIANTMLGAMVLLSDSGIGVGIMSEGGKVWQDKKKLGEVLATGLHLRKNLGLISLSVVTPILMYLLLHNNASILQTTLIIIALIPAFIASLSDSILETIPKLHQDLKPLQKNQVSVSIVRLLLSVIGLFLLPFTAISILANALPRLIGNIKLRKVASKYVDGNQPIDKAIKSSILKIVKRTMPSKIYYCFIGQISIWVISVFGQTSSIAAIGALGRIAFVTNVLSAAFYMLIIPRFARMPQKKTALIKSYISSQALLAMALVVIVFCTWIFSGLILHILGSDYQGLESELVLCVVSSSLSVMTGASLNLYASRGWVINPIVYVLVNLTAMIVGVFSFDLTSLKGVLLFGAFVSFIEFILNCAFGAIKIYTLSSGEQAVHDPEPR